jgi:parvulin-like peptidyl-prolyl isomerase
MPVDQIATAKKHLITKLVEDLLITAYLKDVAVTDEEVAALKKEISDAVEAKGFTLAQYMALTKISEEDFRNQAKFRRAQAEGVSDEKVAALIAASPVSYFDATTVRASHVLISCETYAPQKVKDEARRRLEGIAADIKAGKVTLDQAARKHSSCPSSAQGGDIGRFDFSRMVTPFAKAAFALEVGGMSDVVETSFGYHLIQVTERHEGIGKPDVGAEIIARKLLMEQQRAAMIQEALKANPVTLME